MAKLHATCFCHFCGSELNDVGIPLSPTQLKIFLWVRNNLNAATKVEIDQLVYGSHQLLENGENRKAGYIHMLYLQRRLDHKRSHWRLRKKHLPQKKYRTRVLYYLVNLQK